MQNGMLPKNYDLLLLRNNGEDPNRLRQAPKVYDQFSVICKLYDQVYPLYDQICQIYDQVSSSTTSPTTRPTTSDDHIGCIEVRCCVTVLGLIRPCKRVEVKAQDVSASPHGSTTLGRPPHVSPPYI